MRAALAAHDEVLRTAIEAHDGLLFSHTGDGVAAAFASPSSAVDAAVAAQRGLQLPVRMGVATGEAELRDGDYFGTVLNRAARVMAAGHGGQILVADSTAGLLGGVKLLNLGARRLRDVASPITVFQLQAPGLHAEFPPLRTLDPTPGNLRPPGTSLVGREAEVVDRLAGEADAADVGDGVNGGEKLHGGDRHAAGRRISRWVGFSSWLRSPIRRRCLTRWLRYSASSNNPERLWASRWRPRWRGASG
jgi:hypothetical protein